VDQRERELERQAAASEDPEAIAALQRARCQKGEHRFYDATGFNPAVGAVELRVCPDCGLRDPVDLLRDSGLTQCDGLLLLPTVELPEHLNVEEASVLLGCTENDVLDLAANGVFPLLADGIPREDFRRVQRNMRGQRIRGGGA
jgi:hypothetical protein